MVNEVSGRRPFHNGVCCMLVPPPGAIAKDEVQCTSNDELDDVIEVLDEGEKPLSSLITVKSKKGVLKSEVSNI